LPAARSSRAWFAAKIGRNYPVLDCTPVGVTCEPLTAKVTGNKLLITGRFGVFHRGQAEVILTSGGDRGRVIATEPIASTAPLVILVDHHLTFQPAGVKIVPFYDRTDMIQACIKTVSKAIAEGVVLIVLVLFLILWDIRAALIVAALLPMTAAAAFLLMGWSGLTANLMSLGGLAIALGMIVDGAIVITENISRHMREKANSSQSRLEIAYEAAKEVVRPVAFSFMIIVIVFIYLFQQFFLRYLIQNVLNLHY
jgi:predicted RND superfamily exporter protein